MPSSVTPSTVPVTSSIDPASSWVRNGKPPSSTVGVPTTSRFSSIAATTCFSADDSATRSATNAPATSTTHVVSTPMATPRALTGST